MCLCVCEVCVCVCVGVKCVDVCGGDGVYACVFALRFLHLYIVFWKTLYCLI